MKLSHLWIMTLMELKRIRNDKRRLLILVIGAILPCLAFGFVANRSPQEISVAVFVDNFQQSSLFDRQETRQIIDEIDKSPVFSVSTVNSYRDAIQCLRNGNSRAIIVLQEGVTRLESIQVTTDATDLTVQETIRKELPPILEANSRRAAIMFLSEIGSSPQQAAQLVNPFSIDIKTNQVQEIQYMDLAAAPLIVLIIMGICLLAAVTGVTSERSKGTIERIFASPYRRTDIILSKMLALSLIAIIVSFVILLTLNLIFGIVLASQLLALIIVILVGINAVAFGLLVSAVTDTELESVAFGIMFYFLFMTLMGWIWPLETMHPIFRYIASMTPYMYAAHAIRHVNLVGWGLSQVWPDIAILCGFIMIQALGAAQILKREIR